jgi:hypothetical protein
MRCLLSHRSVRLRHEIEFEVLRGDVEAVVVINVLDPILRAGHFLKHVRVDGGLMMLPPAGSARPKSAASAPLTAA